MLALEEAFISMCQSSRVNILYYSYDTKLLHEKNFIEVGQRQRACKYLVFKRSFCLWESDSYNVTLHPDKRGHSRSRTKKETSDHK